MQKNRVLYRFLKISLIDNFMQNYTCAFASTILSGRCKCEFGVKNCIAEKEFAACLNIDSSKKCEKLYNFLHKNSEFAIGSIGQNTLTVSQQNKIKIGGLKGLNELIFKNTDVKNVDSLRDALLRKYQSFENIPLKTIIPKIANFKIRQKK